MGLIDRYISFLALESDRPMVLDHQTTCTSARLQRRGQVACSYQAAKRVVQSGGWNVVVTAISQVEDRDCLGAEQEVNSELQGRRSGSADVASGF